MHRWNLNPQAAIDLQHELRSRVQQTPLDPIEVRTVAGVDVGFPKGSETGSWFCDGMIGDWEIEIGCLIGMVLSLVEDYADTHTWLSIHRLWWLPAQSART